uniref:Uncharacterized protein n=1 Tax=Pyronema omphalodes (strain CBS 100304) TaxID=1076935 RepID=U4LVL7_PYROM
MYIYPIIRQSVSAVTSRYGLGGITPGGSMHSPDPRASTVRYFTHLFFEAIFRPQPGTDAVCS